MARWFDSWLPGPSSGPDTRSAGGHPGERLGLPATGVGSVVGFGRRLAAITVDWLFAYAIAALVSGPGALEDPDLGWRVLGIWFLITAVPGAVFGASAGMTAVGIRVGALGDPGVG